MKTTVVYPHFKTEEEVLGGHHYSLTIAWLRDVIARIRASDTHGVVVVHEDCHDPGFLAAALVEHMSQEALAYGVVALCQRTVCAEWRAALLVAAGKNKHRVEVLDAGDLQVLADLAQKHDPPPAICIVQHPRRLVGYLTHLLQNDRLDEYGRLALWFADVSRVVVLAKSDEVLQSGHLAYEDKRPLFHRDGLHCLFQMAWLAAGRPEEPFPTAEIVLDLYCRRSKQPSASAPLAQELDVQLSEPYCAARLSDFDVAGLVANLAQHVHWCSTRGVSGLTRLLRRRNINFHCLTPDPGMAQLLRGRMNRFLANMRDECQAQLRRKEPDACAARVTPGRLYCATQRNRGRLHMDALTRTPSARSMSNAEILSLGIPAHQQVVSALDKQPGRPVVVYMPTKAEADVWEAWIAMVNEPRDPRFRVHSRRLQAQSCVSDDVGPPAGGSVLRRSCVVITEAVRRTICESSHGPEWRTVVAHASQVFFTQPPACLRVYNDVCALCSRCVDLSDERIPPLEVCVLYEKTEGDQEADASAGCTAHFVQNMQEFMAHRIRLQLQLVAAVKARLKDNQMIMG